MNTRIIKISRCINSYKNVLGMKLEWIDLLDKSLSDKTKDYIHNGNIHLAILAEVINQTIKQTEGNEKSIDAVLWNKLHDQKLMIKLIEKYESKSL